MTDRSYDPKTLERRFNIFTNQLRLGGYALILSGLGACAGSVAVAGTWVSASTIAALFALLGLPMIAAAAYLWRQIQRFGHSEHRIFFHEKPTDLI